MGLVIADQMYQNDPGLLEKRDLPPGGSKKGPSGKKDFKGPFKMNF